MRCLSPISNRMRCSIEYLSALVFLLQQLVFGRGFLKLLESLSDEEYYRTVTRILIIFIVYVFNN